MKENRRRVLVAFNNQEGSGDDEAKEALSFKKNKARFAKLLIDSLHSEAWKACQDCLNDSTKLKAEDGCKHVFAVLQSIEKVGMIKKTEAGQSMDSFLRMRRKSWSDLVDMADGVTMCEDLLAYFLLRNAGLSRHDRRQCLVSNQSHYSLEGIEKSLRISYFEAHEKEKAPGWPGGTGKKGGKGAGRLWFWRQAQLRPRGPRGGRGLR
ncbi:ANKRD17 [Symbiodinium sp. CCMP2456]|nr:ANKRD17 [Symbiodinium sp. CCMP2456]